MTKLAAPQQGPASERLLPLTAPSPEDELSGTVGTRWGHEDVDRDRRRDISRSPNERLNHPTHFTTRYDRAGPHPKVSPITQQQYMQKKLVKTRGYHLQPPPSFNTEDISHVAASTENISNARHLDSSEVPSHSRMSRSPYSPPPPPDPPDIHLAPTGDSSPPQRVTPNDPSESMDPAGSDTVPPVS